MSIEKTILDVMKSFRQFFKKVQGLLLMTKYKSTKGVTSITIDEAIINGLAPDGGLYVPDNFPKMDIKPFYQINELSLFAERLLSPFFNDSAINITGEFCKEVFNFAMPLNNLCENHYVLELFHGPTLSFKDFGARFFAQCLEVLSKKNPHTVLVATSGDTGSAVACALFNKVNIEGVILFPQGKISQRQQQQITCWGTNIKAIAVKGAFDDCQRLVKSAFNDSWWQENRRLTTANSINIARLLPQILFYAYSSIKLNLHHDKLINFIVPSGNLGNVTACFWAKALGFPIGNILIANNANDVLSDYLKTGVYSPKESVSTLANAMDVGNPSNLERLCALFDTFESFKNNIKAQSIFDKTIKTAIVNCYNQYDYLLCPHTATAFSVLEKIEDDLPWVIVATAHPSKFETIIEPLLNINLPIPKNLSKMLAMDAHFQTIHASDESLKRAL
jgi:threonine synthase